VKRAKKGAGLLLVVAALFLAALASGDRLRQQPEPERAAADEIENQPISLPRNA